MHAVKDDSSCVWHPNTQMSEWEKFDSIRYGDGVWLVDYRGRKMMDGVASMWCNVWGHSNKDLIRAISKQAGKLQHSPLFNLTHKPAERLARTLVGISPGMHRVMYSESGSAAMEIALKVAHQYWLNQGVRDKTTVASLERGYHGDTFGAMAAGRIPEFFDKYTGTKTCNPLPDAVTTTTTSTASTPKGSPSTADASSSPHMDDAVTLPVPVGGAVCGKDGLKWADEESLLEECIAEISDTLTGRNDIGALVMESGAQMAGGARVYARGFQRKVGKICAENDILLIADEIATGLGRLGPMCVYSDEGARPDIVAYGKMLTGGYLPLAATLATRRVYDAFLGRYDDGMHLFHGHTFTGNPIASAVAIKNIAMYEKYNLLHHVKKTSKVFGAYADEMASQSIVGGLRYKGLMMGIDLVSDTESKNPVSPSRSINRIMYKAGRKNGVYLRTLGNVVMIVPPLAISASDLGMLVRRTIKAIQDATPKLLA